MKTEVREGVVTAVAVALGGVLLGLLWLWLAPHVPLVADDQAVYLKDSEGEQAVGVDGTFTLLGLGFGVVSALLVFLLRRRGGITLVVSLAVGGLLGAVLAWRLGIWLGPTQDVVAHAKQVGKGVAFDAPLELKAKGALLAWPIAAMAVHLGITALFGPRDPDPYPQGPFAQDPYPYHPAGHQPGADQQGADQQGQGGQDPHEQGDPYRQDPQRQDPFSKDRSQYGGNPQSRNPQSRNPQDPYGPSEG